MKFPTIITTTYQDTYAYMSEPETETILACTNGVMDAAGLVDERYGGSNVLSFNIEFCGDERSAFIVNDEIISKIKELSF